ncbi:hypothetical protein, partial [Akkermansia sp.]
PFPSIPSPGPSGPLAFRAAAVLACREVYQNILICQYILNQKLSGLLSNLEMSIPNILIMNKIRFCHTPFPLVIFLNILLFFPFIYLSSLLAAWLEKQRASGVISLWAWMASAFAWADLSSLIA